MRLSNLREIKDDGHDGHKHHRAWAFSAVQWESNWICCVDWSNISQTSDIGRLPLINQENRIFTSTSYSDLSAEIYSSLDDPRFHTTLAPSYLKKKLPFCWQKEGCYLLNKPFSSTRWIFATGKKRQNCWKDTAEETPGKSQMTVAPSALETL